jgi:ornithine carbamoyltransferase
MKRDFLRFTDLTAKEIDLLLKKSLQVKRRWQKGIAYTPLVGKSLGLIFDKPSTRTRVSFEVAMTHLGGHALYLDPGTTQLKRGESIADSARVLSRYFAGLVLRTFAQRTIEEWAQWASIPVINGLTDLLHPCQVFCDLLTILEKKGTYQGLKIAYIGDGNNMANTWIEAASLIDINLSLACPSGYQPDAAILGEAKKKGAAIKISTDPFLAAEKADVLYTDVWASMGQERERKKRLQHFQGFQINAALLRQDKKEALVMHCLPAHPGEEITAEVLNGPQSIVFDQAENRLHGQKILLTYFLKGKL